MDFPTQNPTPVQPMPGAYPSPTAGTTIPVTSAPSAAPVPSTLPPTQPAMSNADAVYTMPEKFLNTSAATTSGKPPKKRSWLTILLIAIIALAVLGIIGGIVYIVLQSRQPATVIEDTNTVVNNTADTNTNTAVVNTNTVNSNTANTNTTNTVNAANTNTTNTNTVNTNTANANSNTTNANTTNTNVATDTLGRVGITNTNTAGAKPASKDTDKDQLTNEEESLYSTKADLPDTDNDGYNDGVEVIAGYDPISSASSSRIASSALVTSYVNSDYHYGVTYPSKWLAEALSEGSNAEILFTPKSLDTAGQFIEVIVADNPTGYTAVDWYVDQTKTDESKLTTITSFSGLQGVLSTDGYTAYYTDNDNVYAISYRFGTSTELYFQSTFTLLYKSFSLNVTTPATNSNTNSNTANTNTTNTNNTNNKNN